MKNYKEVERQVKVGDKIKVVDATVSFGHYKNGDILDVIKLYKQSLPIVSIPKSDSNKQGELYLYSEEFVVLENCTLIEKESITSPTISIVQDGQKVIATNNSTGKKGIARCCPEDEFDFNIGAKLAFDRLQEEEKIDPIEGKSYLFEYDGKQYKGKLLDKSKNKWFHEKIWSYSDGKFETTDFKSLLKIIKEIEDIQPTPKFKVGDFVKIILNVSPQHYFPIGQIVKVIQIPREQRLECKGIVIDSDGTPSERTQILNMVDVERVGKSL